MNENQEKQEPNTTPFKDSNTKMLGIGSASDLEMNDMSMKKDDVSMQSVSNAYAGIEQRSSSFTIDEQSIYSYGGK